MKEAYRYPIVILGAGLCGLSTAYHLQQNTSYNYLILESGPEVGGLARTVAVDGFSFDHAIHVLYSRDPYATDLICNILLQGNTYKQLRQSYCYSAGTFVEYPYQTNNYGLPPAIIAKNIMGLIKARYLPPRDGPPPHFEAWIYETFGRGISDHFMIPYNQRQWAWDLEEMSYDWIADRVPVPKVGEVLRGAIHRQKKRYGSNQEFWYPIEGGIQALPNAFLRFIPPERLWVNATVVAVDGVRRAIHLADGRRVEYDQLISTIPMPMLVDRLGELVPPIIKQYAAGLKHNIVHTINVGLDGSTLGGPPSAHWIYFPEESTVFHRISFPGNISPSMVPPGSSSIQMEVSESVFRPRDRARLIQGSLEDLVRVGILEQQEIKPASEGGRVRTTQLVTLDPAYVIYDLKHGEKIRSVKEYLTSLGIATKGRFGEWEYLNMDHAILGGKAAAEDAIR